MFGLREKLLGFVDVGCFYLFSVYSVRLYNSQFHSSIDGEISPNSSEDNLVLLI